MVLVTLEIPPDAQTDIMRADIIDVNNATHRTNKAKVLAIEDAKGCSYIEIISHNKKHYKVGELFEDTCWFILNKEIPMRMVTNNNKILSNEHVDYINEYYENGSMKYHIKYNDKGDFYINVYKKNGTNLTFLTYTNNKPSLSFFYYTQYIYKILTPELVEYAIDSLKMRRYVNYMLKT